MTQDKPKDIEAEKWLLGSILIDNDVLLECDEITPEHFYEKKHKQIYKVIQELFSKSKAIEVININAELKDIEIEYLYKLATYCITSSNWKWYKDIVDKRYKQRKIIEATNKLNYVAYESDNIDKHISELEDIIKELSRNKEWDKLSIQELCADVINDIQNNKDNKIKSYYNDLDYMIGGFYPWQLIFLAARPSMGKTMFAVNMAVKQAMKWIKVLFISIEMSKKEVGIRVISNISEIPYWKISWNKFEWDDEKKLFSAMDSIEKIKLSIDTWATTLNKIKSSIKKEVIRNNADIVYIDYIWLINMSSTKYVGNRVNEMSEVSKSLKSMAIELNIPIIALSQLSRSVESRSNKEPILSDLRDSWSLEQDADLVMMLYRSSYYDQEDKKERLEVFIRKNRNWSTWTVSFKLLLHIMKIYWIWK